MSQSVMCFKCGAKIPISAEEVGNEKTCPECGAKLRIRKVRQPEKKAKKLLEVSDELRQQEKTEIPLGVSPQESSGDEAPRPSTGRQRTSKLGIALILVACVLLVLDAGILVGVVSEFRRSVLGTVSTDSTPIEIAIEQTMRVNPSTRVFQMNLLGVAALVIGLVLWLGQETRLGILVVAASAVFVVFGIAIGRIMPPELSQSSRVARLDDDLGTEMVARDARAMLQHMLQTMKTAKVEQDEGDKGTQGPDFISQKHGFAARFPGKVTIKDYGTKANYASTVEGEAIYTVAVIRYPGVLRHEAIQSAYKWYLIGIMAPHGDNATVIRSEEISYLGHKALDYEYEAQYDNMTMCFKGTYFIVGRRGYDVSVASLGETKNIAYAKYDKFLNSFRLSVTKD